MAFTYADRTVIRCGCSFHTIGARIGKVYIGHEDPDPSVEARRRAKEADRKKITPRLSPLESELSNFNIDDFSEEAQKEMIAKMNLKFRLGSDAYNSFLLKLGLIAEKSKAGSFKPTGLGLLLLGKQPELQFPQARIKFTIRRANEDPIIKDFDGPLVMLPGKIEEYLDVIFPKEISRTGFQRVEKFRSSSSSSWANARWS